MVHITSLALFASAAIVAPISYLKGQHNAMQTEGIEIVGGNEAEVGKHLYVTGLRQAEAETNYCGGPLISPTAVLTSAQCAVDDWINYVAIGSHYLSGSKDGERIKVKKIMLHPKFDKKTVAYDFAILELETPSKVSPIEISFEDDAVNAPDVMGVARSWGTTSSGGSQSNVLKEVGLKIWSQQGLPGRFRQAQQAEFDPCGRHDDLRRGRQGRRHVLWRHGWPPHGGQGRQGRAHRSNELGQ